MSRCPGGDHELKGAWVRFCWTCEAYVDDLRFLVREEGLEPAKALQIARQAKLEDKPPLRHSLVKWWESPNMPARSVAIDSNELEEAVRLKVTGYLEALGIPVYKLEQGYRPTSCQSCGAKLPVTGTRVTLGVADILVCAPDELFFVEFKRPKRLKRKEGFVSNPTPEQERFALDVAQAGGRVEVWRSLEDAEFWYEGHRKRRVGP